MILVRDAMQREVVWLVRDQSVAEAAAVFDERDIGGAPVCDRDGRVLGLLTKTDVAACAARSELDRSVEEAMTPEVISVGADEPLDRAISVMAFEGVHRLVVLDDALHLTGILTAMDVLRELAGFGRKATRRVVAVAPPPTRVATAPRGS
jgi:IMP dehydrogenase